ncbi:MAG: hypothetical protein R3350_06125, partial [Saprospiraceae bacterium]|nr:hypothetical protein [Saprospiraceae bacterium]
MALTALRKLLTLCFLGGFYLLSGQHNDCLDAVVVCGGESISFILQGSGTDDFATPLNDPGCLELGESQSAWFYFEFAPDMPPGSLLEFTIRPKGEGSEDYDFALFGPSIRCDSLGSPVRCSYADFQCAHCPRTGLGEGATDLHEGSGDDDGFLAPLKVQPGEGYYLLVDNFSGISSGFILEWGGTAAA